MSRLFDFENVRRNLRVSNKKNIVALHKYVFGREGDRDNRKRLREFAGFDFNEYDEKYAKKCEYIKQNLKECDLISICNLLTINYDEHDMILHIFHNLQNGHLLNEGCRDEDSETENEDDEVESEENISENESAGHAGANATNEYKKATKMQNREGSARRKRQQSEMSNECFVSVENEENGVNKNIPRMQLPKFVMNFRDIEDSIRMFDGTEKMPVNVWIAEFEETAAMMGWDDFQKFVFAKKSLKGIAKLFVSSERGIVSWNKLKAALLSEFKTTTNSATLHKQMSERKIKSDECIQEYFFTMREMASRGNIDDNALMQYVIDGIRDLSVNKSILYNATNMQDFKSKLKCYEKIREKNNEFNAQTSDKKSVINKRNRDIICFNCGGKDHLSSNCENKALGRKCFKCNKFGHIANECGVKKDSKPKTNVNYMSTEDDALNKSIEIGGKKFIALLDTGSKFNLVTQNVFQHLNKPELREVQIQLVGVGEKRNENKIKPIGSFKETVRIDDDYFEMNFLVIPSKCIDVEVVIGREILQEAWISLKGGNVFIRKLNSSKDFSFLKIDVEFKYKSQSMCND
ncbi:uncharacterized protein LOC118740858 [Rhagoletis pomonella]|uniref:uncharacterized protein LOC118740858 n=1 Tax=Rhagoletis pomonella TaxID=28610 RepID=UPI00177EB09C|nr:uncharacterized protein LOC118740858 [Rhagoletis pomonella]XP_036328485.1 uncharacterized protein LOC118740858 [Rhagoletis pomonella]